jgi:hypothetical protein
VSKSLVGVAQSVAPAVGISTTASLLKRYLKPEGRVLELGCGRDSTVLRIYPHINYVGVDAHLPYLQILASSPDFSASNAELIHSVFADLTFDEDEFTQIVLIDVLEHLEYHDGEKLLRQLEYWCSDSIILKTTNGFVPQGEMDGNAYQSHLSGWTVDDLLSRGFEVYGLSGWKWLRRDLSLDTWTDDLSMSMRFRPRSLWLFLAGISQLFTSNRPRSAFELFAVKEL